MAGGKQTPRQRMINILYLVLLGLIALNVPESLLDSFKKIGDSLATSTSNVQNGIAANYAAFQKHIAEEPARAKPIYDKAKQASALADKLYKEVEDLKTKLVTSTGGISDQTHDYAGRDNMEESERLMIKDGNGEKLRKDINDTRTQLLAILDPKDTVGMHLSLDASDPIPAPGSPDKKSWEEGYFGANIPVAAVMTTLIKIQSDARNDEAAVTKKLLSKFDVAVVTLNTFEGVAVAPTSYIIAGQPYTAQVFLTAYDNQSNPVITINGSTIPTSAGKGTYTVSTGKEGVFTYSGDIAVKGPDGLKHYKLPTQTYQVAKPSAVVSPDKMNVLYMGVDNPLSVSAPGVPVDKLHVSISGGGGSLSGSNGHYEAKVSSIGDATVTISAEIEKGKTTALGSTKFRVKRIPDPKAQFAGKSGGSTSAVNLRAQDKLFAHLDNFEFEAKFIVKSFKMIVAKPHQDGVISSSNSADLSAAQKAALATITPGTTIYFDDIIAVGPDGAQRPLDPIIFKAQ